MRRPPRSTPWRFRRRLTAAFVVVAAVAGGLVSLTSFVLIDGYRNRNFEENAESDARLGLLLAPDRFSIAEVETLLVELGTRGGFEIVAVTGDVAYSTSSHLGAADVPPDLAPPEDPGELAETLARVDGEPYLVIAGSTAPEAPVLYFFFSRSDLLQSLKDFRDVVLIGWAVAIAAAALLGQIVSRRTLRPVAEAAQASRDLAEGLLQTRIEVGSDDEFGAWADAFNDMAAALEQKIADLSAAADRERRFTADVAHELRTPLTSMVSAAELLEDQLADVPASARRPAELLIADVKRFRQLVLELLELARLDAGGEAAAVEPLDVRDALAAVVRRCGLDSDRVLAGLDDRLVVLGDRTRFARVVGNLLTNAVEHGGGDVRVAARRRDSVVEIDVRDSGNGIAPEDAHRIFDRFHKSDQARSSRGPGLGLAIAQQHAAAQGGSLTLRSSPGGGACFTFSLPAAPEGQPWEGVATDG